MAKAAANRNDVYPAGDDGGRMGVPQRMEGHLGQLKAKVPPQKKPTTFRGGRTFSRHERKRHGIPDFQRELVVGGWSYSLAHAHQSIMLFQLEEAARAPPCPRLGTCGTNV